MKRERPEEAKSCPPCRGGKIKIHPRKGKQHPKARGMRQGGGNTRKNIERKKNYPGPRKKGAEAQKGVELDRAMGTNTSPHNTKPHQLQTPIPKEGPPKQKKLKNGLGWGGGETT